ncbi:radical SAM/Cys-rich domain-containing protein [Lishizhenia tianjinensis]|uniref:Radical SAM/Cys-rich domain-containing protein n=1 Tax=Lishizhenia tianjinensis TaxID=477690 RepID=A0A1I6YHZ6_9FLAO|nr:arsenosugar biosynthesis radical SAM (seleno)protein ArsS [Lishizhenia tianjinensis]SFT50030.1 radical SAM/Cys-rich domain-containing protein [Lishizhenia tianjinensis]
MSTATEKKEKLQSLQRRDSYLAKAPNQIQLLEKDKLHGTRFSDKLREHNQFPLRPTKLEILQVNVGYMCDLTCEHCHVDAGPTRKEIMTKETMEDILKAIDKTDVKTVDLTGGAPEMNPHFKWFVEELTKRNVKTIVRSNLTILVSNKNFRTYPQFFKDHGVEVIASMPCYTQDNVDKQRGSGVFNRSIEALKVLNELGYGIEGSGLHLHLVFNPGGPSLPPEQKALEQDYKVRLKEDWNISFNNLYTITNLPISRFLDFILAAGRYEEYMDKLVNAYNPVAAENVMCKNTISVDWEGNLYDCDFNQMLQLKVASKSRHISDFDEEQLADRNIILGQHCYGCTAGAGSSCQGATT